MMQLPKHLVLFEMPQDTREIYREGQIDPWDTHILLLWQLEISGNNPYGMKHLCWDTGLHP